MPSAKRRHKKHSSPNRPTLPSSPDIQQHTQRNAVKNTNQDIRQSSPEHSQEQGRGHDPSHHRRFGNVFRKHYYPHWILIGLIAVLLAIGYQHGDCVYGFIREVRKHPWKLIGREPSWSDVWLILGDRGIERRSNLTLEEFRRVYDGKRPVLITDILQDWGAMRWNRDFFLSGYGNHRVVMKAVEGKLSQAEGFSLPLEKFIEHLHDSSPSRWTYIEDELFIPNTASLKEDIGSCPYLAEDFFKLFPKDIRPWDAMFLWGTKYSRSSLHIDPYNWTGTNAVLKGMKQWKLYPPGQDDYFYVLPDRMSGFPLKSYKYNSPVDAFDPDLNKYPNFAKAKALEFTQYPGELLFIPTGWFHQAYNTKQTMAVSGQVMNTANYRMVLEEIIKAGNLNRESLPVDYDELAPEEQVRAAMAALPPSILDEGRKVNENVRNQIELNPHEHT